MLAGLFLCFLQAPADSAELLQRVAARYSAFDQFLLEVRETSLRDGDPFRLIVHKRLAVAPDDRFLLEVRASAAHSIHSDGFTVRAFPPGSKEFVEQPLGGAAHQAVQAEIENLVRRFAALDRFAASARFLRSDKVKTASGHRQCAVIEVALRSSHTPGWRETLWIDPARALVLRSGFVPAAAFSVRVYREYLLPPGEESPGPALFVFTLPKGARPRPSPSAPSRRPSAAPGIPPA